jgi:hypothetical protein
LNSRLDNVVIVIGDAPVCGGKSLVYKRYYKLSFCQYQLAFLAA